MDLTIPQLEYILQGCEKNNKDMEKAMNKGNSLEDADAIKYLIKSGDIK